MKPGAHVHIAGVGDYAVILKSLLMIILIIIVITSIFE